MHASIEMPTKHGIIMSTLFEMSAKPNIQHLHVNQGTDRASHPRKT
jgi:hypothetical protein